IATWVIPAGAYSKLSYEPSSQELKIVNPHNQVKNQAKRELGFVLMALNIRKIAARRAVYYQIHLKKADFYQIINRNQLFYIA
ncbi:hypothetical protein, partial [Staphylococcus aureus]|uniref:hypothetical protein n=1 Tax=Staphylococcus aureus TaxID=1280 RepID=UPI001962DA84